MGGKAGKAVKARKDVKERGIGSGRKVAKELRYNQRLHDELAYRMARDCVLMEDIAAKIGISFPAFTNWRSKYKSFSLALQKGIADINKNVESAFCKRALGFEYTEITNSAKNGYSTKTIYFPPDTNAGKFWLMNRMPDDWKDRQEEGKALPTFIIEAIGKFFER